MPGPLTLSARQLNPKKLAGGGNIIAVDDTALSPGETRALDKSAGAEGVLN